MPDPTKAELLARIAELEKQVSGKKGGDLEFKVGDKGGVSCGFWSTESRKLAHDPVSSDCSLGSVASRQE
jgi:hypothetical protein